MSTTDVNLMKCDGKNSKQELIFNAMTFLEHPDDIYEIYIKPLNEERRKRDELRRLTVGIFNDTNIKFLSLWRFGY